MVIVGCSLESQYIKKEIEIKKPLKKAWEQHIKRQADKNAERGE